MVQSLKSWYTRYEKRNNLKQDLFMENQLLEIIPFCLTIIIYGFRSSINLVYITKEKNKTKLIEIRNRALMIRGYVLPRIYAASWACKVVLFELTWLLLESPNHT